MKRLLSLTLLQAKTSGRKKTAQPAKFSLTVGMRSKLIGPKRRKRRFLLSRSTISFTDNNNCCTLWRFIQNKRAGIGERRLGIELSLTQHLAHNYMDLIVFYNYPLYE